VTSRTSGCIAQFVATVRPSPPPSHVEDSACRRWWRELDGDVGCGVLARGFIAEGDEQLIRFPHPMGGKSCAGPLRRLRA